MEPSFAHKFPDTGFALDCFRVLQNQFGNELQNMTSGLTDDKGLPVSGLTNRTFGISIETCQRYCSPRTIPWPDFDWNFFASAFTSYLLPWLALTAQLPYASGTPWTDVMSFVLAVGSPALITHSLAITILNRFHANQQFRSLSHKPHADRYKVQISATKYLLAESQEIPLRTCRTDGNCLGELLLKDGSEPWWGNLEDKIRRTRRGVTPSLVAQLISAAISYIFTVISTFTKPIQSLKQVMQISAGTLLIWLIPVIWGWIEAGTQYTSNTIEEALWGNQNEEPSREFGIITADDQEDGPLWLGASVAGDAVQKGPVFNYARLFTWAQLASQLQNAIESKLTPSRATADAEEGRSGTSVSSYYRPRSAEKASGPPAEEGYSGMTVPSHGHSRSASRSKTEDQAAEDTVQIALTETLTVPCETEGPSEGVASLRSPQTGQNESSQKQSVYVGFDKIKPQVWRRMLIASFTAMFVQWGTTGGSIIMAILTPTKGLGCRSGGYLLYGIMGTTAWLLLVVSTVLSHAAMSSHHKPSGRTLSSVHWWLCCSAVVTRYTGKTIAAVNAGWAIASTIFEYAGVYDCCFCHGVEAILGSNAFIILFRTSSEFQRQAGNAWSGGIAMALIVSTISVFGFIMGSRRIGR